MPENTIYVGRPTRWGNPVYAGLWADYSAADAARDFRRWIAGDGAMRSFGIPPSSDEIKRDLGGKNLACWCKLGDPCHADVLLEVANG